MLRPDDEHAEQLSVRTAALFHVLLHVVVVVLRGLVVHLQDLINPDNRAGSVHLDGGQSEHARLPGSRHAHGHSADHARRVDGVVGTLDGDGDAEHQHAVQLEGPLGLLHGGNLAEAVVRALVAREPDVQHGILVRVVAHAPVAHRLVQLLREGVLRHAEVVRQVAKVEAAVLPRGVDVCALARVCTRHPLEAVPEHALASSSTCTSASVLRLPVLVDVLLLLLPAPLLALAAALGGLGGRAALLLLLLVAIPVPITTIITALTIAVTVLVTHAAKLRKSRCEC
mmetsp:Transcript_99306/g.258936  ORF Transcript_99306/g.258936 Transcript_99306/m.258936 type:complete len:284 (-) Transcript_99306:67-918(-)